MSWRWLQIGSPSVVVRFRPVRVLVMVLVRAREPPCARIHCVEHCPVDGHAAVQEVLDGQANLPHRVSACPDREKIYSGMAADHGAVRHRENGGRVEQDQIVSLRDVRKECAEPGASHQLGRIRGSLPVAMNSRFSCPVLRVASASGH